MKLIPLTRGLFAKVDDEDYDELTRRKWHVVPRDHTSYAKQWTLGGALHRVQIAMHTYLTGFDMTDHIDGDGLNNQRANLRKTSPSLNRMNTKSSGRSSRFKGVGLARGDSKWTAWCQRHEVIDPPSRRQQVHLGTFSVEEEAAWAVDEAVRLRFGQWAAYNFPRPGERCALTGKALPK